MKVQCISQNNNISFNGLKFKNNKIKQNPPVRHSYTKNIENKVSLIGWGILFTGLLYGGISCAINIFNQHSKSNDENFLLTKDEFEARQNNTAVCDSACIALQNDIDRLGLDEYIEKWNSDNK